MKSKGPSHVMNLLEEKRVCPLVTFHNRTQALHTQKGVMCTLKIKCNGLGRMMTMLNGYPILKYLKACTHWC